MDIITIDGVDLPHPSSLKIQMSDIDSPDTTRNEEGVLWRYRVRQGVYKILLEFNVKLSSDVQTLVSAIEPKEVMVTFPTQAGRITKRMYVGDRSIEMVLNNENVDKIRWNISFNLTEY